MPCSRKHENRVIRIRRGESTWVVAGIAAMLAFVGLTHAAEPVAYPELTFHAQPKPLAVGAITNWVPNARDSMSVVLANVRMFWFTTEAIVDISVVDEIALTLPKAN